MKNNFWTFSDEQKSMFVAQTSERVGLPPQAVEKDWWVTMTLKALFESSCRDFITFKGGTSLSKGWHVIERFSEDIDIAIDKSFWGIAGDNKSQRDRIRKLSRAYIEQRLVAEMQALLEGYGASVLSCVPFRRRTRCRSDAGAAAVSKYLCEYRVCGIANPDRIQLPVDERTA